MSLVTPIETGVKPLAKWAAYLTTIGVFGGAIWFIYNNIWKPQVRLINVDYQQGTAQVGITNVFGVETIKNIYGSSSTSAGGGWGVRLAGNMNTDYTIDWNRVELVKNDLVSKTIDTAPTTK